MITIIVISILLFLLFCVGVFVIGGLLGMLIGFIIWRIIKRRKKPKATDSGRKKVN